MKKIGIIFGSLLALILVAIVVIPFVVDVDHFRPEIERAANEQINGKLKLGKLSLSLWGKISVKIAGVELIDAGGHPLLKVAEGALNIPVFSIFSGSPLITFSMQGADLVVIRDAKGGLNWLTLMKAGQKTDSAQAPAPKEKKEAEATKVELPSLVANARLGVELLKSKLRFDDAASQTHAVLDPITIKLHDVSLSRKTELELIAEVKTESGPDAKIVGPVKLTATLNPKLKDGVIEGGSFDAKFDADDLEIQKGSVFHKKPGVPANVVVHGSLSPTALTLKNSELHFHNAKLDVSGEFQKTGNLNVVLQAKPIDLKPWGQLIPALNEFELGGIATLIANVKGISTSLQYSGKLELKDMTFKGPMLKAKPRIQLLVDLQTDRIERFFAEVSGPGTQAKLTGKVISFQKPQITFDLTSTGMDLDQWIDFPKEEAKAAPAQSAGWTGKKSGESGNAGSDMDAMLDPIRKNEALKGASIQGSVSIPLLKVKGAKIEGLRAGLRLKDLKAGISDLKLKAYDGAVAGSMEVDVAPAMPKYSLKLNVSGIDLQKAVETQFFAFKNTLVGIAQFSLDASGASFNPETAKRKLVAKGSFQIANAKFATIDVMKMVSEAISNAVAKVGDKIPGIKNRAPKVSGNRESKYKSVTGTFTIQDGKLRAPDFSALAVQDHGLDLKGATELGLIDQSLDAKWEIIDTYRLTGASEISANIAGKEIKNILAKGENDPVMIPVSVGCKWSAPCPKYDEAPIYFAKIAADRVAKGATQAFKAQATDKVKDALKGGLKSLFGR